MSTTGLAQDDGRVTIDARRCARIESPDERLACFEAQVNEAAEQPSAPASPAAPSATTPPPAAAPAATQVETARVAAQQNHDEAANRTEWVGVIAALEESRPRAYLVTLSTGEVWQQTVAERYALRVGQRVRTYSNRWGESYRLEAEGLNGFIQVGRVR